eukprot:1303565-Prymnesium_polylepis.1
MLSIPPRHYAIISNPVVRDAEGKPTYDAYGQAVLLHGELEIRLASETPDPFPLFPGEALKGKVRTAPEKPIRPPSPAAAQREPLCVLRRRPGVITAASHRCTDRRAPRRLLQRGPPPQGGARL